LVQREEKKKGGRKKDSGGPLCDVKGGVGDPCQKGEGSKSIKLKGGKRKEKKKKGGRRGGVRRMLYVR